MKGNVWEGMMDERNVWEGRMDERIFMGGEDG